MVEMVKNALEEEAFEDQTDQEEMMVSDNDEIVN